MPTIANAAAYGISPLPHRVLASCTMPAVALIAAGVTRTYTCHTKTLKKPKQSVNRKAPAPYTFIRAKPASVTT